MCVFFIKATTEKPALWGCDVIGKGGAPPAGGTEPPHWLLAPWCLLSLCLSQPQRPRPLNMQSGSCAVRLSISLNCHCSLVGVCSHEKGGLPTGSTWVRVGGRIVPFPGMKVKSFPCSLSPEGNLEDMQETLVNVHERGSHQHSQCGSCEK